MDKIFIEDLRLRGKHGVSEEERAREQEFLVDISASVDARKAGKSDELADTADYGSFRSSAKQVVESGSFRLLEKLADAIAAHILQDGRVQEVTVTIRKSNAYPDATPGITITRP